MFKRWMDFVRRVIQTFGKSDVKTALGADVAISDEMAAAMHLWGQMYLGQSPWLTRDVRGLNLPAAVASEMARLVTLEMGCEVSGSARADYLAAQLAPVLDNIRRYVEYGAALGGMVMKPHVTETGIAVDMIRADCFFPTDFDSSGRMLGAVFVDQIRRGNVYYTRLERHTMEGDGCTIQNVAYRSNTPDYLGSQVALDDAPEWESIQPELHISGVTQPMYGYFKMPLANTVDASSPLGVSVYARAVGLIEEADKQYSRLLWEFESAERAVYADETAFARGADGKPKLPNKRLYRTLDLGDTHKMFEDYTPDIRESNIINGLNTILRKIEFGCGLAYGTLSDVQDVDKTAEEIRSSKQRSYATVSDTQKALRVALEDLVYAMDVLATLYQLAPQGGYEMSFAFDDSIVADRQTEFVEKQALVTAGIMQPWEFRVWYFGESEQQAKEAVASAAIPPGFGDEE